MLSPGTVGISTEAFAVIRIEGIEYHVKYEEKHRMWYMPNISERNDLLAFAVADFCRHRKGQRLQPLPDLDYKGYLRGYRIFEL